MDVGQEPRHLARIAAKGPGHVAAAALSPDGNALAFCEAGPGSLRLFRLSSSPVSPHSAEYSCLCPFLQWQQFQSLAFLQAPLLDYQYVFS